MEDTYAFIIDFGCIHGQGYCAVFDGHAGKYAAEWCGQHFHEVLLDQLRMQPDLPIPDILNQTFHSVDMSLFEMVNKDDKKHSGCTAVVAFLRVEDAQGKQSFLQGVDVGKSRGVDGILQEGPKSGDADDAQQQNASSELSRKSSSPSPNESPRSESPASGRSGSRKSSILKKGSQVISAFRSLTNPSSTSDSNPSNNNANSASPSLLPSSSNPSPPHLPQTPAPIPSRSSRITICPPAPDTVPPSNTAVRQACI